MSQRQAGRHHPSRRNLLQGAAALGAAAGTGVASRPGPARAQEAARTLVIASPATPQGLDIEFDVSLGSIDALGALYDYMLAYEKMPDPKAPGVMREDIGVHGDRPNGLALRGRLAETWDISPDGLKATFVLRQGVKSNWGNTFSAADVKWTWDRKFNLKGQGIFQTAVLGLKTPDQIKVEADHVVSFSLDRRERAIGKAPRGGVLRERHQAREADHLLFGLALDARPRTRHLPVFQRQELRRLQQLQQPQGQRIDRGRPADPRRQRAQGDVRAGAEDPHGRGALGLHRLSKIRPGAQGSS